MDELSERSLWIGTIALTAAVLVLSLLAVKYVPDMEGHMKTGTLQAIDSLHNEGNMQDQEYQQRSLTERFYASEKSSIDKQVRQLTKEL